MIDISDPEVGVEELMLRMREGATRRTIGEQLLKENDSSATDSSGMFDATARMTHSEKSSHDIFPRLVLQPEFQTRDNDFYHAADLLQFHDREFVQNAYRAILKRYPDATGYRDFIEGLRAGWLNKIDVLARLRYSSEGRAKKVAVKGLFLPAAIRQAYRVPLVGYILQLCIALARLPTSIRSQQQFEAHTFAQQQQITDHLNDAVARLQQEQKQAHDEMLDRLHESSHHIETRFIEGQTRWQKQFDEERERIELSAHNLRNDFEQGLRAQQAALEAQWQAQQQALQTLQHTHRQELQAQQQALQSQQQAQQQSRTELVAQARRVTLLLEEARQRLPSSFDESQMRAIAGEEAHTLDALYVSFEDQFRGSREQITERLEIYLPLLKANSIGTDQMPLLDVGSGRGEWLELLETENLRARGVDSNRVLVEQCRKHGLEVIEADVLDYLRGVPDASVGAVTGFHLVEHLPFEVLMKFLDETVRVVKQGGAVIFETPNPANVTVGSCNFYFDPTHRNPLPSQVIKFLVESRGFNRVEILKLNPSDAMPVAGDSDIIRRFNEYFYGPMDYAVVGWKP